MQSCQQHRQLCVSHDRIDFTPEAAKQQARRTRARIKHVAMRVLLVSENRGRRLHHPARHIGMQIERHDNRDAWSHQPARGGRDIAFGIVLAQS